MCSGAVSHLLVALGAEACRRADRSASCAVVQWCSVSPACRPGCRSLPESRKEREVCSGAVVQCLTCLSPWVQKPAGEQTGARVVQWCSGALSDLPVAVGAEACRRADRSARCAVVQ